MAKAVAEGAQSNQNITVDLNYHIDAEELASYDAILVDTPTYHTQMPIDFKNLFKEASTKHIKLKNKLEAPSDPTDGAEKHLKLSVKYSRSLRCKSLNHQYAPNIN